MYMLRCGFGFMILVSLAALARGQGAQETVPADKVAAQVRALTGAHTRIAWVQDGDETVHSWGCGPKTLIMGFDTDDGKGVRTIVSGPSGCAGPVFAPDGAGLVFTRVDWGPPLRRHLMYVNWDGTGLREVTPGWFVAAAVADPKEGFTWLYGLAEVEGGGLLSKRVRMDKPEVVEPLWDRPDGPGGMTVSLDGKYMGGVYNFAAGNAPCGAYEVPNIAYHTIGTGCLPCMLPCTNPYRLFVASGDHRGGSIATNPENKDKMVLHRVSFADAPLADNRWEVDTPRWSNNIRFVVLTAPFTPGKNEVGIPFPSGAGDPKYRRYYDKVEVSIGRLDEGLTKAEKWVRITNNGKGDYLPQAWIDPGRKARPADTQTKAVTQKERPAAWPGNRAGLVYLWENGQSADEIQDTPEQSRICLPDARDCATFGRYAVMDLTGGSFAAKPESDAALLEACRKSGAFTLEALVQPDRIDVDQLTAIMSFSADGKCNFMLGMVKNRLVMHLRTSQHAADPPVKLAVLEAGIPQHVIVTYDAGKLVCYVNGKVKAADLTVTGDLRVWTPAHLVFGDDYDRRQDWSGTLEGIVIYSHALDAGGAKAHCTAYVARLQKRRPANRLVVDAKLYDITPNSTPKAIKPYRRLLLVDSYEVAKVVEGKCGEKNISVARWGILDDKVLQLSREKEKVYRLVLEPMDDNPHLESERILNATDDLTLSLYYNVEKPAKPQGKR